MYLCMDIKLFPPSLLVLSVCRKSQQYDSKWYIPLSDLTFHTAEESEPLPIPQAPDEELDAIKIKISSLRSEIQRERVQDILGNFSLKLSC